MLEIERWGEGRFKPLVMVAQTVAVNVKESLELVRLARERPLLGSKLANGIRPKDWLRLYRRPLSVEAAMVQCVENPAGVGDIEGTLEAWPLVRRVMEGTLSACIRGCLAGEVPERVIRRANRWIERLYVRFHLPLMKRMLAGDEMQAANMERWLARPEILFALGVAMPCFLTYQRTPWELYLEARRENIVALENLLRLDPDLENDKAIQELMLRIRKRDREQFRMLKASALEGLKEKVTLVKMKYLLGGFIMHCARELDRVASGELLIEVIERNTPLAMLSQAKSWIKAVRKRLKGQRTGCRLTGRDITGLFDAVARDRNEGLVDLDFCKQPNSNYQQFKRKCKDWEKLGQSDIFRAA